jgi:hypothetical protein
VQKNPDSLQTAQTRLSLIGFLKLKKLPYFDRQFELAAHTTHTNDFIDWQLTWCKRPTQI